MDLEYLDTMNQVDAVSGLHVHHNRTSIANANQSSLLLQVQDELWEAVRKARPFRRGFYDNEDHPHRLFTRPDILLGATQVSLLCIYLVLLRMIWVRPKYRRYRQQRGGENKKKSHSERGLATEAVQDVWTLEGDSNATMMAKERVVGLGLDPAEEDKTPDPSEGDKDSVQGTVDEKTIEQTGHLPNSYNTPERSRALQVNAYPSPLTADSVKREPLHPSQLPQAPASSSSAGAVAEDSTSSSSLITMSAETMTQELQERQKQWQNFQQNAKAKEAESKQQIQHLKTYLQQKEQQLQSTYVSQTLQYQNVASQVEQLQDKFAAQKSNAAVGRSTDNVTVAVSEAVPSVSCDDLRTEVRELERDLLQFQSVAHAKNVEYATQVQTLQTKLFRDTTHAVAGGSVHEEDNTPETSRPPPSAHSETGSPASLHSNQNNIKATVKSATSAFQPVTSSVAAPSDVATQPFSTKARTIVDYGDLVSEVQMLTKTIQRKGPSKEEAATPANTTTCSKDLGPHQYARVLEQHLKERAGECARMEEQLSRLQFQLSHQESEVARLRTNSKAEKATLTAQLRSLEGVQEVSQGRLERFQSQNATLLAKNDILVKQVETLQELQQISQQGKNDFDWKSKIEALNRDYQETNAQLQANLIIQGGQCREFTAKIESLTVELDECRKNASQAEQASTQRTQMLERQLNEQQEKHYQEVSVQREERAVMSARVELLQQEVTNTKSELELVQSKAAQKEEVLAKELYTLKQELIANKTQFETNLTMKDHQKEEELEKAVEASKALQNCEECRKDMAAEFEAKEKSLTTKIQSLSVHLQREIQNVQIARNQEASLRQELDHSQLQVKTLKETIEARDAASTSEKNALCQQLQDKSKALQSALNAKERSCEELSMKVQELQESLDECTEELDEFQDEVKSKEIVSCAQVQSLQTEIHYASKKHKEALVEMKSLSSQVMSLQELNEEKSAALKSLAAEKKSHENALTLRIGALVDDLESKDNCISQLEGKTASLVEALESRGHEISKIKSQAEQQVEAHAQQFNARILSLQEELETRECTYTTELCKRDMELKNLKKTVETQNAQTASLESAMEDFPFSPTASPDENGLVDNVRLLVVKFTSCSHDLEVLRADKTELETRVEANENVHQEQLRNMNQSLANTQKTIEEQATKLREQKKRLEYFQKESSTQEQAYLCQLEELRGELAAHPDSLREKLSETETRCNDLATMVEALTMEVNVHSEKTISLEEKLAVKKAECLSMSSRLSSAEMQCESLEGVREELKRAKKEVDQMARAKCSLEMALRETRANSASLELKIADLEKHQQELTSLKSTEAETKTELNETSRKLASLQAEIQVVREEREEATSEKKSLEEAMMQTQTSLDSCEMRLRSAEEKEKHHRSEKESATQEIDSLKTALADSKNQISGLQDNVYANNRQELLLNEQIREKDQHCSDLRDQVASSSKRLLTLKERALVAEKRSGDMETTHSELESRVVQLSKHVKELQNEHERAQRDHESAKQILESDLAHLTKENLQIKDANEKLAIDLRSFETQKRELDEHLSRSQAAVQLGLEDVKSLKEEVSRLKTSERKLREVSSRVPVLEEAVAALPALEATLTRTREQKQEALDAKAQLEEKLAEAQAKAKDAEDSLARKEKVVQRLFTEKNSYLNEKKSLEKKQVLEISDLKANLNVLKSELEGKESELQHVKKRHEHTTSSLKQAEETVEDLRTSLSRKEDMIKSAFGEKMAMAEDLSQLKSAEIQLQQATSKVKALEIGMEKMPVLEADVLRLKLQLQQAEEATQKAEKLLQESQAKAESVLQALSRKDKVVQRAFEEKNQESLAKKAAEKDFVEAKESISQLKTQLEQQKEEIDSLVALKRALESDLQSAKTKTQTVATLEVSLRAAQEKVEAHEKKIIEKEEELVNANLEKTELAHKLHGLTLDAEEQRRSTEQIEAMQADLNRVELARRDALHTNRNLETALSKAKESEEKQFAEHRSDAGKLQSTISTLQENLLSRDLKIVELSQKLKVYGEKHVESVEMREARETSFEHLNQEKIELAKVKKDLEDELIKTRSALKVSKDEAMELEDANKSYLKALKEHDAVLKDLAELKKVKKNVEDKLDVKMAELTALEVDFTLVKKDLDAEGVLQAELDEAKASCRSLSLKVTELEDKLATQCAEKARLVDEIEGQKLEQEARFRKATEELTAATAHAEKLDKQVISLNIERENDSSIRDDLEAELSEKQSALEALYGKMSDLEASAELKQKEIFLAESEKSDALLKTETLEAQLKRANEKLTSTQQNVADLEDANKSYLDALANQMAISKELDSLKETCAESRLQFENATKNIASLEKEIKLAKEEKQSLKSSKANAEELLEAANKKIFVLEEDLTNTKQEHEKLSLERRSIGSDAETLEKLSNDKDALRQKQESAAAERDRLSEDLSEAQKKTRLLEQKIIDLENAGKSYLDALATQMSLSKELTDLGNAKTETEEQLKATVERLNILEEDLESARLLAQRQTEIADANSKAAKDAETRLGEKKKAHQETLDEIELHFKDLSEKVNVVTEKLQQKELQLELLEKKTKDKDMEQTSTIESLNQLLEEVRSANSDGMDKKVADLESLLQQKEGEIKSLQGKVEETNQTNKQVQSLTEELKEQQDLQEKINKSMRELMELVEEKTTKCSNLKAQVEKLKEELEGANALQAQLETARSDQAAREIEYNGLSTELTSLRNQVAAMELEGKEKKEAACGEIERLKIELRDQREQSEKLSDHHREMQTRMAKADLLCDDLTSKLSMVNEECVKHQSTIAQLQEDLVGQNDDSSAEMEKLRKELLAQKESCEKLSCANQELEQVLEGKNTKYAELAEQMKSLENDAATRAERAADLEKSLTSTEEKYAAEVAGLKKELSEHHAQQEKMNQSMTEMLALWEHKESQCSDFKERLDELTSRLEKRDALIAKLQDEAVEHVNKVEELKQQHGADEAAKERLEKVTIALAEKEKEIVELDAKLKEIAVEHEKSEHEWEIKITQSESELESMKNMRKEEMLKIVEDEDEDGNVELQESKLTNRLENLTSKISEGEKQLADLEREFKEKLAQSEAAAQTQQRGKTKKGKVKLLSRFRR